MKKNESDVFLLFSRVLLIYPIQRLKDLLGEKIGFKIKSNSYLNPVYIERSGYSIIIKNDIEKLSEYHYNLRFLFKQKDLVNLKILFEEKGYKDYLKYIVETLKKSVIGLSVIINKKVNDKFSIKEIEDPYNLGYIDKFIFFEYEFNIERFPSFTVGMIVHEAFIEFIRDSLFTVEITLPYLSVIRFFSQPILKYLDFLFKKKFFFYPEKVDIKENFFCMDYKTEKILQLKKNEIYIYLTCNKETINFLKIREFTNQILLFYSDFFNYFSINKSKEISFNEVNPFVFKDSMCIIYKLGLQKEVFYYKLIQIIPIDLFKRLYFYLFKKDIVLNIKNLEECLKLFENTKVSGNFFLDFVYREKISLNISDEGIFYDEKLELKMNDENKIKRIEEIVSVEDRIIQFAISRMKQHEIISILKSVSEEIKNKILCNMSTRNKEYYLEEIKKERKISNIEKKIYISKFINNINALKKSID